VEVTPEWIEPVIDLMESDSSIAACQPKLGLYSDKEYFEYAGAAGGYLDKFGYAFCRGRLFMTTEKDTGKYNTQSEIVWTTGACTFVRSKLFHDIGRLDGDFFAHFEEIDLCWRLKNAGYKIFYSPKSVVYHVGGGSLPYGNPRKTFLNYRNNMSALVKNLPPGKIFVPLLIHYILDNISACKSLLSGNWRDCTAILKAHFYTISNISMLITKRRKVWKAIELVKISAPNRKGFYKGSIIVDYFIKGIRHFSELPMDKFEK
jgi:GT2 family glycosyltransferase